jgi:hypothetical protein
MKFFRGLVYAGAFGLLCWVLLFIGLAAFTCSCASTKPCNCPGVSSELAEEISGMIENNVSAKEAIDSLLNKYRLKRPDVWDDIIFEAKAEVDLQFMRDIDHLSKGLK